MRKWKREKYVPSRTYKQVCKKKRLFMRLLGVTLDEEQRRDYELAVNRCDKLTARITEKAKRYIGLLLILLCLCLMQGCTGSIGGGASASVYYPKNLESPESRKQHTQPTLGMARNNRLPMVGKEGN